jgi:hypothetical protein
MMNDIAHMIARIALLTLGRWNIVSSGFASALVLRHEARAYLIRLAAIDGDAALSFYRTII